MPVYTLNVFSNAAIGQPNWFLGGAQNLAVSAVDVMQIQDNDPVLQDESNSPQESLDLDGEQVLAAALGLASAGQVVRSVFKQTIVNSTTGETGTAYTIRIYSGTSNENLGGQVGDYYWASTIKVSAGDVVSLSSTGDNDYNGTVDYSTLVACFTRGTAIRTPRGEELIETLSVGDMVLTQDRGEQAVRWIGSTLVTADRLQAQPHLRPIRIKAGALGTAIPSTDLLVSPQHRILVRSRIAQRMFGVNEVLVAAKQLVAIDGIDVAEDVEAVEYFHILFDQHEVVVSNGAESESLYTGTEALKSVGAAAREEILALFPELAQDDYTPVAARELSSGRQGRTMAARHAQNRQALVS